MTKPTHFQRRPSIKSGTSNTRRVENLILRMLPVSSRARTFRFDDLAGYYVGVDNRDVVCRTQETRVGRFAGCDTPCQSNFCSDSMRKKKEKLESFPDRAFPWISMILEGSSKYRCGKLRPPARAWKTYLQFAVVLGLEVNEHRDFFYVIHFNIRIL